MGAEQSRCAAHGVARALWLYAEGATLSPKQRTLAETALQKIRRMLGLE